MPGRPPKDRPKPAPAPPAPEPSVSDILTRLGITPQPPPELLGGEVVGWEPPLFLDARPVPIATAPPVLSSARALVQRDHWTATEIAKGLAPQFLYTDAKGVITHYITSEQPESGRLEVMVGEAAWAIVNAFDTSAAYMHLAFSAHAARQEKPWAEDMRLRGSDLMRDLGLWDRKDLTREEKVLRIIEQARLLNSLAVQLEWTLSDSKRFVVQISRMWEVSYEIAGQKHLIADEGPDLLADPLANVTPDEVILHVRPGLWARSFLNRTGLAGGSSLNWFSYLADTVFRIDPYREPIASKLAVYLTLTWAPHVPRRKVSTLVDFAFPAALREAAQHDRDARYNVKQSFDNALYVLSQAGWRITFPEASYPANLVPGWARPDGSGPQGHLPRGYWPAFLQAVLEVQPPGDIAQRIAANRGLLPGKTGAKRSKARLQPLTGEEVRQGRVALGLSQQQLGEILGRSQAWVALIERGKRTPGQEDLARLRAVLEESGGEQA